MKIRSRYVLSLLLPALAVLGGCSVAGDAGNGNEDANTNQNAANTNGNANGTANENQNDNSQPPDNSNDNGTGNTNSNGDPGNSNVNANNNGNVNDNTNSNANANDNGNDLCPDGFVLTVDVITGGAGVVDVDPPGECFSPGTDVSLRAAAADTFTFVGFSGDVTGTSADVVVTMDADRAVTAAFTGNCFIASDTTVLEFDALSGDFIGEFVTPGAGGLSSPLGAAFGPDGDLYVSSADGVRRFNGTTGAFLSQVVGTGDGGLRAAFGMEFGPGGNLFVADGDTVLEYDGGTGNFVGQFVTPGDGGLGGATALHFGPSGNLFVMATPGGGTAGAVFEYDGDSGAFIAEFVALGSGGLGISFDFAFGPGGDLFASTTIGGEVIRYDGATGHPVICPCVCLDPCHSEALPDGSFAISGLNFPSGVTFGPNGNVLVVSGGDIREFAVPAAGPTEQTPFIAADPSDPFAINNVSFITFKPLP